MNQRANSDDLRAEVYELAAAGLAEELSDDQAQRLCDVVCQDPEACRHYVRFMSDTLELSAIAGRVEPKLDDNSSNSGEIFATDAAQVAPAVSDQPSAVSIKPKGPLSRTLKRHKTIGIAAAVVVSVGAISWMANTYVAERVAENQQQAQPERVDGEHVAILNGEQGVKWIEGERGKAWDPRLWPGEKLVIAEGLIELKYLTGARVVIEGPAEFVIGGTEAEGTEAQATEPAERLAREEGEGGSKNKSGNGKAESGSLDAANSGYLTLGSLVARCDTPASQGFTIETASGRVEDLGTEFSVGVDRGGDVRLHVFEGRVRLEGTTGSLAERNQVLAAGEGLAWDATGQVRSSSAPTGRRYSALASRIRKDAAADIVTDLDPGLLLTRFGARAPRLIYPGHEPEITDAPAELMGLAAIIPPRGASRTEPGAGYRFEVRERARLYLLVHNRGDHAPVGWQRMEGQVTWKTIQEYTGTDTVYTRIVEPGDIEIPAHAWRDEQSKYGVPHACLVATVDDAATDAPANTDSSSADTTGVED